MEKVISQNVSLLLFLQWTAQARTNYFDIYIVIYESLFLYVHNLKMTILFLIDPCYSKEFVCNISAEKVAIFFFNFVK